MSSMSSAMTRLFRVPRLSQGFVRRGLASKSADSGTSAKDTIIGLGTFMACFLIPSGWILANLEEYKKRD